MAEHNEVGKKGEDLAAYYLLKLGYKILVRNWRFNHKELDIIATKDNYLVFIEVKTRTVNGIERPQDAITLRKQKKLIIAANAFIEQKNINMDARFDVISVILDGNKHEIEHIDDAFYPLV